MNDEKHIPVLRNEVLQMIPENPKYGMDGTFGRGGHTKAIWAKFSELKMTGLDRDQQAILEGKVQFENEIENGQLNLIHTDFLSIKNYQSQIPKEGLDFILLDLGVSSPQLDESERGFSFYQNGPLDMRMDQTQSLKASDIVNTWSEEELIEIFKKYGELRSPYRVVRAIFHDRKTKKFETTRDLAGLIERILGWSQKGKHPATQYFLALRLVVNEELTQVEEVLEQFLDLLNEKGRLLVISFHSLEDRIVKNKFKEFKDQGHILTKKVIQAQWNEKKTNPRSRSAKLRVFEKGKPLPEAKKKGKMKS